MRFRLLPLLLLVVVASTPAPARAATVAVESRCFVDQGASGTIPVPFTVTGLAAGQSGTAVLTGPRITGTPIAFGPADGSGSAQAESPWTSQLRREPGAGVSATLTVTDSATGAPIATSPVRLGRVALKIGTGKFERLSKKIDWKVAGLGVLTGKNTYYAHYFTVKESQEASPRPLATMSLGVGNGPCSFLKTKRRLTPFTKTGTFVVGVQTTKRFDPSGLTITTQVRTTRILG